MNGISRISRRLTGWLSAVTMLVAALLSAGPALASAGEDMDGDGVVNVDVIKTAPKCAWYGGKATVYAEVYTGNKSESPVYVWPVFDGGAQTQYGDEIDFLGANKSISAVVSMPAGDKLTVYASGGSTGDFTQTDFFSIGDCRATGNITQPWARGVRLYHNNTKSSIPLTFRTVVYRSNGSVAAQKAVTVGAGKSSVASLRGLPRGSMAVMKVEGVLMDHHNIV